MVKKIKFPLEMENGVMVRTLEELKENFSLSMVIGHAISGKLLKWLEDRNYSNEVEKLMDLSTDEEGYEEKLCSIFDVEYCKEKIDLSEINFKNDRIKVLKQYTADSNIINDYELVALNQNELDELLKKESRCVYLIGEEFNISNTVADIKIIGLNNPKLIVDVENLSNLVEKNVITENVVILNTSGEIIEENLIKNASSKWNIKVSKSKVKATNENTGEEKIIYVKDGEIKKYKTSESGIAYLFENDDNISLIYRGFNNDISAKFNLTEEGFSDFLEVCDDYIVWSCEESNENFKFNCFKGDNDTQQVECIYSSEVEGHNDESIRTYAFYKEYFIYSDSENLYVKNINTNKIEDTVKDGDKVVVVDNIIYFVKWVNGSYHLYRYNIDTKESKFIIELVKNSSSNCGLVGNYLKEYAIKDEKIVWIQTNNSFSKHSILCAEINDKNINLIFDTKTPRSICDLDINEDWVYFTERFINNKGTLKRIKFNGSSLENVNELNTNRTSATKYFDKKNNFGVSINKMIGVLAKGEVFEEDEEL